MENLFLVCTVILASLFCLRPVKKILSGKSNIIHMCMISFYIVQVVPLVFKLFFAVDVSLRMYPQMYAAMNDSETSFIYCIFVLFCESVLSLLAKTIVTGDNRFEILKVGLQRLSQSRVLKRTVGGGMFISMLGIFFAPKPDIYLEYAYFYTHGANRWERIYTYHNTVVNMLNRISFASIVVFYLLSGSKKNNKYCYLAIFFITWISGKRTLLVFSLLAMLIIDIIKKNYERKKFLLKILCYAGVVFGYFELYSQVTGKGANTSFYNLYSIYFSRMSTVQTAIYERLNNGGMLDYAGQSIIYDLLFWIPRSLWNSKPVMYTKYFTAYVMNYGTVDIDWQFQANIWTEFISNFSLMGPIFAIIFIYVVAKITEKSKSILVYMVGMVFIVLYTVFDINALVQLIGIVWVFLVICSKIKIKI